MTNKFTKLALAASVAGWMLVTAAGASAEASDRHRQDSHEQFQERIKAGLDKLADRLEIKASQQAQWKDYADSVEELPAGKVEKPAEDADAAAIARFRADRAKAVAEKLSRIAEATAKLESVLTSDQRKIFDEVSRRSLERMRAWRSHERP